MDSFDMADSILRAAMEKLLKQGWIATENDDTHLILEQGMRAVRVTFMPRLDNAALKKIGKKFSGFSVVLTVDMELPINLSFNTAIIDLVHARRYGAPFPDEAYSALFAAFLKV